MIRTSFLILFVILISVGVTSAYALNITLGGTVDITQILNMMGNRITNVGIPTEDSDVATKGYVDSALGTDTLTLLECAADQVTKFNGTSWLCSDDVDTDTLSGLGCTTNQITQYNGTSWICVEQVSNSDVLMELSCSNDEIPKFNGTDWKCSDDLDTNTDILFNLGCTANQVAQYNGTDWTCINQIVPTCSDGFVIYGINQDGTINCKPSLFMIIPSPFGEEGCCLNDNFGVWGVNLVNPTEVDMTVSKVTIVANSPSSNNNDVIFEQNCNMNMISPTADWSCPRDDLVLWQNSIATVSLPARSAVEFLVAVEPGATSGGIDIDAITVHANVFTNLGPFGNVGSYQSSMREGDTPIVNVFLTSTLEDRSDFHGVQDDMGIVEKVESTFMVSLADMDEEDDTYIEDGAKLVIHVPRLWTNVTITSSEGFVVDGDPSEVDDRVTLLGDGSTLILLVTEVDVGGPLSEDKDVLTVSFDATPPCNEITGEKQPYIMRIIADGKTGPPIDSFPIGPLNESGLIVEPEPTELDCP